MDNYNTDVRVDKLFLDFNWGWQKVKGNLGLTNLLHKEAGHEYYIPGNKINT